MTRKMNLNPFAGIKKSSKWKVFWSKTEKSKKNKNVEKPKLLPLNACALPSIATVSHKGQKC